jgi:hypothetical protein
MIDHSNDTDRGTAREPHREGAGPAPEPTTGEHEASRRASAEALMNVRASDLEPYTGLRYLSKLFRMIAVILLLVLVAEVATGVITHGSASIPTLLGEVSRLIVLAGLLWGTGDLAMLLIDIGHDLRATRILIGRQVVHHVNERHPQWTAHPDWAPRRADGRAAAGAPPTAVAPTAD